MAERDREHIFVRAPALSEPFRPPPRVIESRPLPAPANRREHGQSLRNQLEEAQSRADSLRENRRARGEEVANGIYVTFESIPGLELALQPLDPQQGRLHPELYAVQRQESSGQIIERATVFVPDGKLGYFLKKLSAYLETAQRAKPKSSDLIERIHQIGIASLEMLWTDAPELFPSAETVEWWEVWLRRRGGSEIDQLRRFADSSNIDVGRQYLSFTDRTVVLVRASASELAGALEVLDDLAELRKPRAAMEWLAHEPAEEQAKWVEDLAGRTQQAAADAPSVCVLDTGVHQPHPLLSQSLHDDDCQACEPTWGTADHHGHGTEMAGLALYGDLGDALGGDGPVVLLHRLESVKILPPPPAANPPELYGAIAATAVSLAEIQAPKRRRTFCCAITADAIVDQADGARLLYGKPTSWSASVDAIAAGQSISQTDDGLIYLDEENPAGPRLIVQAAGNIWPPDNDHLSKSDVEPVEDPGQAWNAITVGAFTDRDTIDDRSFDGWTPIAQRGELAPSSRTSVSFHRSWPIKPDVVLEGGNVARSPDGTDYDTPDSLRILTTRASKGSQRLLTGTGDTSAATAQCAKIAASISAEYPAFWPETLRALIVHSAEWTARMREHFDTATTRVQRIALQRRYGMGVPNLERATRSARDALTLIVQDSIRPFDGQGKMREMHLHELPWPSDVLAGLGEVDARLRVTLSYFIEPNPGSRGWRRRYSYASHGLRFEMRRPTESTDVFRKRINQKALVEEERRPLQRESDSKWFFGPVERVRGSLHTDIWVGPAVELASRGAIAVFPVAGWWKERKRRDHSSRGARYALIVSIETPGQDVDIWTPVAQEVGVPVVIET